VAKKARYAIFLFPKEKWQKRKRPHGYIPRQIINLFAKIPENVKKNVRNLDSTSRQLAEAVSLPAGRQVFVHFLCCQRKWTLCNFV